MSLSLRTTLLLSFLGFGILVGVLELFGVVRIRHLADTSTAVLEERMPLLRCSEEALLAMTAGSGALDKVWPLRDPVELGKVRALEEQFRESVIVFEMFTNAMIWGSESEAFRYSSGAGLRNGQPSASKCSRAICSLGRPLSSRS